MSSPKQPEPTLEPTVAPEAPASPASEALFPEEGFHWERYELLAPLGRGGMGEVYEARDRRLGRLVALKFIRGGAPEQAMRFLQEARAQARIDHPHVCKVYEVGEVRGRAYIAMQLIRGRSLDREASGLALEEKLRAMKQVAEAIHEAHRLGIIHRDLKPSNIMIERGEGGSCFPVVMDFGLAHDMGDGHGLTASGALLGTPSYMAPEQARGDVRAVDRRSDVYSLGVTLYELLTGQAPFAAATLAGTLQKVLNEEPLPPRKLAAHLPGDLETLVLKCLNKEPEQRYGSARMLAEDLARYLDGEPILARRPSLSYRLRRRAAKHRTLVAVSAVSLACMLVLAAFGVRSWLEARRTRVESEGLSLMAEQLGQQVKEMEWFLRTAYTLPLHDTRLEQGLVLERMERIASQPRHLGKRGEGLVHYARGRGYLAMHRFEQAHEALTRARDMGVDSPELHYALGRVLGELYHQAMEDARRGGDKAWREERQRALEARYLTPALQSLERSRGLQLESPLYLEALIAFYRRDHDAAARLAAQAMAKAPWVYEARKLAGDVAHARAMEQLEQGRYEGARADFEQAVALYAQAIESGRSDARNYEALTESWLQRAELDKRQGHPRKASLEQALAAIDKGLQAEPERASGYTRKAQALMHLYRVVNFQGGGQDARPLLAEWIATAARAVELDPRDVYAYDSLGYGHFMRGLQEAREGRAPGPAWDEATRWLRRALELQPDYPWGHNDLALVYRWRATHQREHGEEPRLAFAEAERHLRQAVESDPKYLFAHANLAELYNEMAEYALAHGRDPRPDVERAIQKAQEALSLDGNFYSALNHRALAELTSARYLHQSGGDPRPPMERALQLLERSVLINPTFARTHLYIAMCQLLAAQHALGEGLSPVAALEAGQRALAEARRHDPSCVNCRIIGARLGLTHALWAKQRGGAALPLLQHALSEARRAVELAPYFEAHQELARVYWRLAEEQPPARAATSIEAGLAEVERALRLAPELAHAHAIRGGLLLLQARAASGARERHALTRQAHAARERAFGLNPLLRREYEEPRDEDSRLLPSP